MNAVPIELSTKALLERLYTRLSRSMDTSLVAGFVRNARDVGPLDHYKVFPAKARELIPSCVLDGGDKTSQVFLRAAIIYGMLETLKSEHFFRLPDRVRTQQLRQFQRIVDDNDESDWLRVDHDLFHKEFGIATLRLYVTGAQLADPRCGIPRSVLLRSGISSVAKNLAAIIRLGGFRKYFQIHTHTFMLDAFNEEGWNECYLSCAELYKLHPEVLGMYGSSWFYDPVLDQISPRLSYLRATPMAAGAELFFIEEGGAAINNSISTSPTRRQLYEARKYFPKSYMMAWAKNRQIVWAEQFLKNNDRST